MSTPSVKPLQTLKGVFSVPKTNYRRDFLRENKLSLRDLQRSTVKKQGSDGREIDQKSNKQAQPQPRQTLSRRSLSQCSHPSLSSATQARTHNLPTQKNPKTVQQQTIPQRRTSNSQQRWPSNSACKNNDAENVTSILSKSTFNSLTSCDKEIQTEDIHDEAFLYDALKKCAISDTALACKKYGNTGKVNGSDPNLPLSYRSNLGQIENDTNDQQDEVDQLPIQDDYNANEDNDYPRTTRSNGSRVSHLNGYSQELQKTNDELNRNFDTITLFDHPQNEQTHDMPVTQRGQYNDGHEPQLPLSGRSRQTIISTQSKGDSIASKRSKTSNVLKINSREDIRLPRYLEREKRAKEEQRARELERDPNCPMGHYVLPEAERLATLAAAQHKFETLISEINHMPMTTQTLRVRTRRAEIDRELESVEAEMRLLSKAKVYIKKK